ncbi:uncharacterized protein LOC135501403 [Lineus longissimus]|uniref:uncharacterized protein LOC135492344 n=1 Tax=Lineus longissimus TaxID=88925 RepID=UPI002B4C2F92
MMASSDDSSSLSDISDNFNDSDESRDSESIDLDEEEFEEQIGAGGAVKGYQFEPHGDEDGSSEFSSNSSSESAEEDANMAKWRERMTTTKWCECDKKCVNSLIPEENACCREKAPIDGVLEEYNCDFKPEIACITDHPAFHSNCLDVWSLQLAYRLFHKKEVPGAINLKYRYVAYRQLIRWCWRYLGEGNRVPLPACAVHLIRKTFPPEGEIVGFKYPPLKNKGTKRKRRNNSQ